MYEIKRSDICFFNMDLKLTSLFFQPIILYREDNLQLAFLVRKCYYLPPDYEMVQLFIILGQKIVSEAQTESSGQEFNVADTMRQCNACVICGFLAEIKGSSSHIPKHTDHVFRYLFPFIQYRKGQYSVVLSEELEDPFAIISNLTSALWLTY